MKKSLFLLAVMICFSVSLEAQTFEFCFHNESVTDGGQVIIPAVEDEFGYGELWCESNPSKNPGNGLILKLLSDTSASGKATINIDSNTLNPSTLKWCMGGECVLMKDLNTLTKDFSTSDGIVQVQFDAENIKSEGELAATLSATINGESHTVKILFTNGQSTKIEKIKGQREDPYYTLEGNKTDSPSKGLYIRGGKKILLK